MLFFVRPMKLLLATRKKCTTKWVGPMGFVPTTRRSESAWFTTEPHSPLLRNRLNVHKNVGSNPTQVETLVSALDTTPAPIRSHKFQGPDQSISFKRVRRLGSAKTPLSESAKNSPFQGVNRHAHQPESASQPQNMLGEADFRTRPISKAKHYQLPPPPPGKDRPPILEP